MGHSSVRTFRTYTAAAALALGAAGLAAAQPDGARQNGSAGRSPMYQRRAFEWNAGHGSGHRGKHVWQSPPVNVGWFQRPYPYHLDYYRMRYGGSYAPYFGNLYGPPQVVTAPPYYGPYYGGFGTQLGGDFNGGYGGPAFTPGMTNGVVSEGPLPGTQPVEQSSVESNGETLPVPAQ